MPINTEHLQVFATPARTFATKTQKHIQIMKKKFIPQVLGMVTILFAVLAIYLDVEKGISVFKFVPIVVFGLIALLVVQWLLSSLYSGMIAPEVVLDKDALLKEALQTTEEEPLKDEEPLAENDSSTSQEQQVEPVAAPQQYSCLDRYEVLQEEVARKEVERKKKVLEAVNEYVAHITAGYPAIKQGKRYYIYQDELDAWLESSRTAKVKSQTYEEENAALLASHRRKPNLKNWECYGE